MIPAVRAPVKWFTQLLAKPVVTPAEVRFPLGSIGETVEVSDAALALDTERVGGWIEGNRIHGHVILGSQRAHAVEDIRDKTRPFYRLRHPKTGDHFYTVDSSERDRYAEKFGYRYEREEGFVFVGQEAGTTALEHWYLRDDKEDHAFLINDPTKPELLAWREELLAAGYVLPAVAVGGTAGYVFADPPPPEKRATPLYGLVKWDIPDHFYTIDPLERDRAKAEGYEDRGIVCYVLDEIAGVDSLHLRGNRVARVLSRTESLEDGSGSPRWRSFDSLIVTDNTFGEAGNSLIGRRVTLNGNHFVGADEADSLAVHLVGHTGVLVGNQAGHPWAKIGTAFFVHGRESENAVRVE